MCFLRSGSIDGVDLGKKHDEVVQRQKTVYHGLVVFLKQKCYGTYSGDETLKYDTPYISYPHLDGVRYVGSEAENAPQKRSIIFQNPLLSG